MEEMKRLADLKAEKEKSEEMLKDITPAEIKAQAEVDPLPITKISYRVNNSTKEACMRTTRNNHSLDLTLYDKFVLKMLGFSEWLEVHDLPYKVKSNSNDLLLKNLKTKFQWAKKQARKLSIPPPSQLTAFGLSASEKKRKRSS
ncbi:hypothetical protein Tco_0932643 [Tanacetum coccineum]